MQHQLNRLAKKKLSAVFAMFGVMFLPLAGICQPPTPGGGVNTDAVPFDDNMNLLFLAAGVVFAMVVVVKQLKQRKKSVG